MKRSSFFLLCFFSFAVAGRLSSQTVPGVVDNYSGSSGVWLNPSSLMTTYVYDDISLGSVSVSFENDFAFLPPRTFWPSLLGLRGENGTWATFYDGLQDGKEYYYHYFSGQRNRNLYECLDLVSPSLMKTFSGNHAVFLSLRNRLYTSVTRMPWEVPVLITESLKYEAMHHITYRSEDMRCASMAWSEVNMGYATTLFDHGVMKMDAGLVCKLLLGMSALSGNTAVLDYEVVDQHHLSFNRFEGDLRMALPLSYRDDFRDEDRSLWMWDPLYKGMGLGLDFGITLTNKRNAMIRRKPRSACDDEPTRYFWRLGVSVMDLGTIGFGEHLLGGPLVGGSFVVDIRDFDTVHTIDATTDLLDSILQHQVSVFDTVSKFHMGLPSALSVQFDVNPYRDFYCQVVWVVPMSRWLYDMAVERASLISVTPRYERSVYGVSLPLTLYDYHHVTAGVFFRVGPLTLGTNDLLSLAGLGRTRAVDFQVSLRFKLDRGDCLFDPVLDACGDKYRNIW